MKKLFFIIMIALYSTLSFASISLPYPGNNPLPRVNLPQNKFITPTTTIPSPSSLSHDAASSTIEQFIATSLLSNLAQQQIQSHQAPPKPKYKYDDSYLRADAATIEKWKQRGKTATKPTTTVQEKAVANEITTSRITTVTTAKIITIAQASEHQASAAAPHKCEAIHILATMLAAYPDDHKKPIVIPIDIDCVDRTEEKNQEPDPKFDRVLFMQSTQFIAAQFVNRLVISYNGQPHDSQISFEKNTKDNHRNIQNEIALAAKQRMQNEFSHQLRNALWQNTSNFIQKMGLPQDIVEQAPNMYYSNGSYLGNKAELITIITNSGSQRQFIVPSNNTTPFELHDNNIIPIEHQTGATSITNPLFDPIITPFQKQFEALKPLKQMGIAQLIVLGESVPFTAVYHEDGRIKTDKQGNPIDVNGNIWEWDKNKKVYHVHKPGTKTGFQIDPEKAKEKFDAKADEKQKKTPQPAQASKMSAPELAQPEQKGCGGLQEPQRLPILDHPKPDIETSTDLVHPIPEVENPTDTAHAPDPALDELKKPGSGCGGKLIPGLQEIRDQLFNFAEKIGEIDWLGIPGRKRGDLSGLDVEFKEKNKEHIFDDRDGHVVDTPENRERIKKVAKDPTKYLGPDENDNEWYGEILPDGTQWWAQGRKNIIINGGLNNTPREYNPQTGLNDFDPSKRKTK